MPPASPRPTEVRSRRVAGDGVELAVQERGDPATPTVLLLHGYPDTQALWSLVAPRLAETCHVVSYDLRGAGDSSEPSGPDAYALRRLARDALAVIDAVAPRRSVHLVGHDWGAIQGWEFTYAEETAERVASLTSIGGAAIDHVGAVLAERARHPTPAGILHTLDQLRRSWYMTLPQVPGLLEWLWPRVLAPRWSGLLQLREQVPPAPDFPAPTLASDGVRLAALYRGTLATRLLRPRRTDPVPVPVLVIEPTGDRFLAGHTIDALARFTPDLTRRRLAGGHWSPRTQPELVTRWIARHVERVERGTPLRHPDGERSRRRPLAGKLALITGAGSGIGRVAAVRFAQAGADLILIDRDLESARRTVGLLLDEPVSAEARRCDVADRAAVEALAAEVGAAHEAVDIVVNNAGVGAVGGFLETEPELWRQVLDVNLGGVVNGCRAFGAQMVERGQGGHIVNVSSMAAYLPSKQMAAYNTSKAAVLMFSECLRAELAGSGIGVSAICPGIIHTPITTTTRFGGKDEAEQQRMRELATRAFALRGYPPERVAEAILRAVLRNRAVVPVAPEAHLLRVLARLSPTALRALARADLLPG